MRCVSRWQSSSNRAPRNPAQQRAQWPRSHMQLPANGTSATPKIGRHRGKCGLRLRARNRAVVRLFGSMEDLYAQRSRLGLADYTCASGRWDNRRSAPGWAGQQQTAAGLTDPSAGGIAIRHRRLKVDVRAIARPIVLLAFAAISKGNGVDFAKRSVMVDRLGYSVCRIAGARPRRDPSAPAKRGSDPSQARACWSSVVDLDNGERAGHPRTASPNGNNPHISAGHRQLEHPRLCCDPRCKHDRCPNARFSERQPELAAPPQQLRKVVRKVEIERLLSRDSPCDAMPAP